MMKTCSKCRVEKPILDFYKNKANSDGAQSQCKDCQKANSKMRRENRSEETAERNRQLVREWRKAHPGYSTASARKWKAENPERVRQLRIVDNHRRRSGVTYAYHEYETVLLMHGNRCVKCGIHETAVDRLHVDHIIPLSRGGTNTVDNLQPLCPRHNIGKGNRSSTDYRKWRLTASVEV